MKTYLTLTKFGIAVFVLITGLAGYAVALPMGQPVEMIEPVLLLLGLYLLSSGSFALNQAQEKDMDGLMPRTAKRPVVTGTIAKWQAYVLGFSFVAIGSLFLALLHPNAAYAGLFTVLFYNVFYTMYWKPQWTFGAVPGAIPGAMPVVVGYAATGQPVFSTECVYLFMIMFFWQMPHFWSLAIRYKDDYAQGGFPVLPAKLGVDRTLYHIGLYTLAYVGLALVAPLFLETHVLHLLLVIPFSLKVAWEFMKYFRSQKREAWLPFFLWVNLSMLVFVAAPVFDRWLKYYLEVGGL